MNESLPTPGIRGEPTEAPADLAEPAEMPHVANSPTVAPAPNEAIPMPAPDPPVGELESDILELSTEARPSAAPAARPAPIELPAVSIEPPRDAEARVQIGRAHV